MGHGDDGGGAGFSGERRPACAVGEKEGKRVCEHRWNSRKLLVCSNWLEEWCGELATRDRDGGGGLLNSGELVL